MQFEDRLFQQAVNNWDLENLYVKLAQAKQISRTRETKLTSTEKAILRGLLCGYSPKQIATELHWTYGSLNVELTKGIYRYVETLTNHDLNTIRNWRNIAQWLEADGYKLNHSQQDLQETPDISNFYGREEELAQLEQWIVHDRYRLVTISGMGGIGKTTLVVKLIKQIQKEFDYVIWQDLKYTPVLSDLLTNILKTFTQNPDDNISTTLEQKIIQLIEYLRSSRCLLVLDSFEEILGVDYFAGLFQQKYKNYRQLIERISKESHQSCLVLISQDEPADSLLVQSNKIGSLQINGLGIEAKEILAKEGLSNPNCWRILIEKYQGNPLALKLVCANIKEVFGGNVARFLEADTELGIVVPNFFRELLKQQFERLSEREKQIIYCLAVCHHPLSIEKIQQYIQPKIYSSDLIQALYSLKKRSLIERSSELDSSVFTLPLMVKKYIIRDCQKDRDRLKQSLKNL
ncbi:MAG: NB-ARC domain-containing protein [Xenococcaceae cyanobacterium]